jgi:hypothetical protein
MDPALLATSPGTRNIALPVVHATVKSAASHGPRKRGNFSLIDSPPWRPELAEHHSDAVSMEGARAA